MGGQRKSRGQNVDQRNGATMRWRAKRPAGKNGGPDVKVLEMLLDCAMMEGAELRLPLFVLLLRMAQSELAKFKLTSRGGSAGELQRPHRKAKVIDHPSAIECRSFAEPAPRRCVEAVGDVPHGLHSSLRIGD